MLNGHSFHRAGAVVVALAISTLIALPCLAQKVKPAEVGLASIVGDQYSGSSIQYRFDLLTRTNGLLLVKATIKGKKLKGTFDDHTANPAPLGVSVVTGPSFVIPTNFTGKAVVTLKIYFNNKRIASKILILPNVVPPPPPPPPPTVLTNAPVVSTSLYDVGFDSLVTLDGSVVTTAGLSGVTYAWKQTDATNQMQVALSATNVPAPTFTTPALTNFVDLTEKFGSVGVVGIDTEQATEATYHFRLLVKGNAQVGSNIVSITRTGLFTVVSASPAPGHANIPVGVKVFLKGDTNATTWAITYAPPGSTATLLNTNTLTPALVPNVEGPYVITNTTLGTSLTVQAASWTGVQFCNNCHGPNSDFGLDDLVTRWSNTGHATFMQRMLDGNPTQPERGTFYAQSCLPCHTVGNNPAANNGGFDDVAKSVGWKFPSLPMKPGNYAAMPDSLKTLANIQCENCHGPGSRHPGQKSLSLDTELCAACHQDGHYHIRPAQWENGPHSSGYKEVGAGDGGLGVNAGCARCHSPNAFIDMAKRVNSLIEKGTNAATAQIIAGQASNLDLGIGQLSCQACHDPHDNHNTPGRHQLRIYDTVVVGDLAAAGSVTLTNRGAAATCMYCHSSRRLPMQLSGGKPRYQGVRSGVLALSHESPVAEVLNGLGAVDYGVGLANSYHTYLADCTTCHMYQLRNADATNTPLDYVLIGDTITGVDTNLYHDLRNIIGDHSFNVAAMYGTNEVQNIAACNQCHTEPVTSFDFIPSANWGDIDGNNKIEGVQTETQGLLSNVLALLTITGLAPSNNVDGAFVSFPSSGLSTNAALKDAQLKAAWNWFLIHRDKSDGVHNTQFTIRLLQSTYTDLSTNWGIATGNPTNTYKMAFPNAYLR